MIPNPVGCLPCKCGTCDLNRIGQRWQNKYDSVCMIMLFHKTAVPIMLKPFPPCEKSGGCVGQSQVVNNSRHLLGTEDSL